MCERARAHALAHLDAFFRVYVCTCVSSKLSFSATFNRFSRDVETIDNNLPIIIRDFLSTGTMAIVTLIVISISTPLFLTLVVPVLLFYYFIQVAGSVHSVYCSLDGPVVLLLHTDSRKSQFYVP